MKPARLFIRPVMYLTEDGPPPLPQGWHLAEDMGDGALYIMARPLAMVYAWRLWHYRYHILHTFGFTALVEEGGSLKPGRNGCYWCTPWGCYKADRKSAREMCRKWNHGGEEWFDKTHGSFLRWAAARRPRLRSVWHTLSRAR